MNPTRRDRVRWCKPRASGLPPPSTLLSSSRQRRTTSFSPSFCIFTLRWTNQISTRITSPVDLSLLPLVQSRSDDGLKISELLLVIIIQIRRRLFFMWVSLSHSHSHLFRSRMVFPRVRNGDVYIFIVPSSFFSLLINYFNRWILICIYLDYSYVLCFFFVFCYSEYATCLFQEVKSHI